MKRSLFALIFIIIRVALNELASFTEATSAEVQFSKDGESETALADALTDLYIKKLHQLGEVETSKRTLVEDPSQMRNSDHSFILKSRDKQILQWQRKLIEDRQKKQQEQKQPQLLSPTSTVSSNLQLATELQPIMSASHQVTQAPTGAIMQQQQSELPPPPPRPPAEDSQHHHQQPAAPSHQETARTRNSILLSQQVQMLQNQQQPQFQQVAKLDLPVQQTVPQQSHQSIGNQLNLASQMTSQQVQAHLATQPLLNSQAPQQQQQQQMPQPLARAEIQHSSGSGSGAMARQQMAAVAAVASASASSSSSGSQLLTSYSNSHYHQLYLGHNPFIEILKPLSYADDNIVTLNLSHSHIYEIDSEAFVGQRFEHIDLSNNKLGLIHSRSFRIGPSHSRHNPSPFDPLNNSSKSGGAIYPTRRPPPTNPKSVTIDLSHNPAIVALSGAFDHIDVPNCLLNFTNSTVELKFGAFKKYFKDHPGHIVDVDSVDCCEQEWLLGYKHNFLTKTHCDHDPNLYLSKVSQQTIIDSCIAYVTSARHSMTIQGPSIIHQVAATPRAHANSHTDNQYLTYLILGGTAMILTSLSIYIIFYMFSLKAAFVYQMQNKI